MKNQDYVSKYDYGMPHNYVQIFGTNRWFDYIPLMPKSTKPEGDGIYFQHSSTDGSEDEGEEQTPEEEERPPANFRKSEGENGQRSRGGSQGPIRQQANQEQAIRPGPTTTEETNKNEAVVTRQGDVMIVHNDRGSQYRNLNNIVRSDVQPQEYKSNESQDNKKATAPAQFKNEIGSKEYQDLKKQFQEKQSEEASKVNRKSGTQNSASIKSSAQDKNIKTKFTNERQNSKASSGALLRNTSGGTDASNLYSSPGQTLKPKTKTAGAKQKRMTSGTRPKGTIR